MFLVLFLSNWNPHRWNWILPSTFPKVTRFQFSRLLLLPRTTLIASNYFWSLQPDNIAPWILHLLPPMQSQKVKRSLLSVLTVPISFLSINLFIHSIIYFNLASAPILPWICLMSLIMSMPFILENIYSDLLFFQKHSIRVATLHLKKFSSFIFRNILVLNRMAGKGMDEIDKGD